MIVITVNHEKVTRCANCPRNKEFQNKLWGIIPLPPSHHCIDTFEVSQVNGRLIWNPNIIPDWCPHADK